MNRSIWFLIVIVCLLLAPVASANTPTPTVVVQTPTLLTPVGTSTPFPSLTPQATATPTPASRLLTQAEIAEIIWTFGPYHRGNFFDEIHVALLSRYYARKGIKESQVAGLIKGLAGFDPALGIPADKAEQLSPFVRKMFSKGMEVLTPDQPVEVSEGVYVAVDRAFDGAKFSDTDLGVDGGRMRTAQFFSAYTLSVDELAAIEKALTNAAKNEPGEVSTALEGKDVCLLLKVVGRNTDGLSLKQKRLLVDFVSRAGCIP